MCAYYLAAKKAPPPPSLSVNLMSNPREENKQFKYHVFSLTFILSSSLVQFLRDILVLDDFAHHNHFCGDSYAVHRFFLPS